jgi:hypothetical protein
MDLLRGPSQGGGNIVAVQGDPIQLGDLADSTKQAGIKLGVSMLNKAVSCVNVPCNRSHKGRDGREKNKTTLAFPPFTVVLLE